VNDKCVNLSIAISRKSTPRLPETGKFVIMKVFMGLVGRFK